MACRPPGGVLCIVLRAIHACHQGAISVLKHWSFIFQLDIGARDVSDGRWLGALSLTVPLCALPPASGRGALLLSTPNKRKL